jgi:hypothetical protein
MSAWESSYASQGESSSAGTLGVGHQRSRPRVPVNESWRLHPRGFGLAWPDGSRLGEAGLLLEVPAWAGGNPAWRRDGPAGRLLSRPSRGKEVSGPEARRPSRAEEHRPSRHRGIQAQLGCEGDWPARITAVPAQPG